MASTALILCSLTVFGVLVSFGNGDPLEDFPSSFARGYFKKYLLKKKEFSDSKLKNRKVSFNFTTECGSPELPSWLHLEQRRASASAYLYGAPGNWSRSTKLEVIGWDKETYNTELRVQDIHVTGNIESFPWFQAEFFIKNRTLDQFLEDNDEKKIAKIVKDHYWTAKDLDVTMVISAIRHGGRVPLPHSGNHEGVVVRVGSSMMWPSGNNTALSPGEEPNEDHFLEQGFEIKWEAFKWVDLRKKKYPEARRLALLPADRIIEKVSYAPPVFDDSARDFDIDFILVVVIPILIILLFVLILSLIMCFSREGRRKRDQETPHLKLTHHHNIQRSTLRLRELSKPRDPDHSPQSPHSEDPKQSSHTHGGDYERLAEDGDDDRTDGRNAPPPYRMPPGSAGAGAVQQV